MTAVASPPAFQPIPTLVWNTTNGIASLDSMSADDVSRMLLPRKNVQRTNSSSSVASSSSSTTTISAPSTPGPPANGDGPQWATKKKPTRALWPPSKAEPTSGVTTARSQVLPTGNAGKVLNGQPLHQPAPIVPSQHVQRQQNGARLANGQGPENGAVLCLLPMNGTFERKQISVPFYPDVLRIGRQTNTKTVPTPLNGYFDSKVLSRQHAEVWADRSGKIFIRDVKSSNGTFVNGQRLSPENRESEPHELREHDILELGIDIVSEDQKEIVHHKVSAKVEFAGISGGSNNVLDLNFGDIDPSAGVGLLPSPLSQPLVRGRTNGTVVNGRMSGPPSVAGSQASAISQQRQLNFWQVPVNVDHVVRMLSNEMKQIRHQNSDLIQTDSFLQSLLTPTDDKEKSQKSPQESSSQGQRQMNGRPKLSKADSLIRFSDPPAPPPQQPLPEKPDAKTSPSDSIGHSFLKRSDTDKQKTSGSPTNTQPSHILSLVEALTSAKKEIESQGARVKQLEDLLVQERTARENAEERARQLEGNETSTTISPEVSAPKEETTAPTDENVDLKMIASPEEQSELAAPSKQSPPEDQQAEKELQSRLDTLIAEMQGMKQQMEAYRQRAEKAESEATNTRLTLAQMIARFRDENADAATAAEKAVIDGVNNSENATDATKAVISSMQGSDVTSEKSSSSDKPTQIPATKSSLVHSQRPSRISSNLHHALTTLLQNDSGDPTNNSDIMMQSAPYASMLGVVLLGVGIMAYLNNWQGRET